MWILNFVLLFFFSIIPDSDEFIFEALSKDANQRFLVKAKPNENENDEEEEAIESKCVQEDKYVKLTDDNFCRNTYVKDLNDDDFDDISYHNGSCYSSSEENDRYFERRHLEIFDAGRRGVAFLDYEILHKMKEMDSSQKIDFLFKKSRTDSNYEIY